MVISVVKLFCFLLFSSRGLHWLGSVRIRERLSYIVQELKKYDIVGLQEVCTLWVGCVGGEGEEEDGGGMGSHSSIWRLKILDRP